MCVVLVEDLAHQSVCRWMEVWDRKRRQYICGSAPWTRDAFNVWSYACVQPHDDLRTVVCHNKANKTLIEVLKTDLECGWGSAGDSYGNPAVLILVLLMGVAVGV